MKTRGVVFSLDAAIAVTVVVILLLNTSYYFSTASRESISQMQLVRIGSDVLNVLDNAGDLRRAIVVDYKTSPANPTISETLVNVSKYLPESFDMRVEIFDMAETEANSMTVIPPCSLPTCYCGAKSCNGTFNVSLRPLERGGLYGLRLNVTIRGNATLFAYTREIRNNLSITISSGGYSGMVLMGGLLNFYGGPNTITFIASPLVNASIHWFTVLGAREYAGATPKTVPALVNETFIGSGEKFIVMNETSYADFGRLARFYIWVK